ncbi:hypothetical protein BH11MYX4_BH11MYX4_59780 [soil metagenome]|nr:nucleotidyl transferase AbiEii/AbiGii toxin family protein [Labilithrix sp.]
MRSPVDEALADLARAFDTLGVGWFLFGAQAAIIYGSTRVTEDIDVTVALGDHPPKALAAALARAGFTHRFGDSAAFVEKTRVLPVVHGPTGMPVDVVLAGPGLEELFLRRRRRHRRGGASIPVASPEDLIVMKLLAGRPRDLEDVRAVLRGQGEKLDLGSLVETLRLLEEALAQDDLQPLLARLRREASRSVRAPIPKRRATVRTATSTRTRTATKKRR